MRSTTVPNFPRKLINSKRINFNRTLLLKNCFSGSQKGERTPFEPQFCAQKWRNHNLGEEPRKPKPLSLLFQQGRPCVKVMVFVPLCQSYGFCSQKGQVPLRNFRSPRRFWKKRNFHGEFGDKGRLTWNILQLILFYPTKRREFGNPKLKEPNFPIDLFSVKFLVSNASRH